MNKPGAKSKPIQRKFAKPGYLYGNLNQFIKSKFKQTEITLELDLVNLIQLILNCGKCVLIKFADTKSKSDLYLYIRNL